MSGCPRVAAAVPYPEIAGSLRRLAADAEEQYKDLEAGKWVKVQGWEGPESARAEIRAGEARGRAERRGPGRREVGGQEAGDLQGRAQEARPLIAPRGASVILRACTSARQRSATI